MADRRGGTDGQNFRELEDTQQRADHGAAKYPVGAWKQGRRFVLHRDAPLPALCLATSAPTHLRVKRTFAYVPGMVALTILLSPFIWLLVRWLVQAKIALMLPLAEEFLARERRLRIVRAAFALIGTLMFAAGIWQLLDARLPAGGLEMIFGGVLIAAATFAWSVFASTRLRVVRYEEPYIWLGGVHPDFIDKLPDWPYE